MKFEENLRRWVHWLGHLTENDTKQKNFLDFKSSVTEAFIKKGEDIISKQMQNDLWN